MYFKRYFSGALGNLTDKENRGLYYGTAGTTNVSVYKNQTDCLGNAIVQTLRECGIDAEWEPAHCIVWLDKRTKKRGFSVYFTTSPGNRWAVMPLAYGQGMTTNFPITMPNNVNNTLFTSTSYGFYITLKGEPKTSFVLLVGSDSNPSAEVGGIDIICCVDLRVNEEAIAVAVRGTTFSDGASVNDSTAYYYVSSGIYPLYRADDDKTGMLYMMARANTPTCDKQFVCLFPFEFNYIMIAPVDGVYNASGGVTLNNFYEIDGEEYYFSRNRMIKCTTPAPS